MLKHMILITMSVFGAASIAVAGTPINLMGMRPMTVKSELHKNTGASTRTNAVPAMPRLRRPERLPVQVRKPGKPGLIPQGSRTQPGIRGLPGHRGMVFTGRRASLRLPPPHLRITRISSKIDDRCGPPARGFGGKYWFVATTDVTIYNDGGPLGHVGPTYGFTAADEVGGANYAHLEIWNSHLPPIGAGQQKIVKLSVITFDAGKLGKLPGIHHLLLSLGTVVQGVTHIATRPMTLMVPPGYCQSMSAKRSLPDLIPQVSNPFNGVIIVKNIGNATAGASKLTVSCKKLGSGPGGDCPSTPALDALPADASGALLIPVPALHAGQVHTIHLPVQGLKWDFSKDYRFTYKADATHVVAESNEKNNTQVARVASMHKIPKGSATHGNMPDLIPQVSNPFNGIIKVKNIGNATAAASKLTVNCKKLGGGFAASAGDCPSTTTLDALPADSSGALLISVPALHAGQVHTIHLPVQGLKWGKGKYQLTYKADATHAVAESDESNNIKTMVRQR